MLSFTSNPFSFVCVRAILLPTLQRERGGERGRGREREGEGGATRGWFPAMLATCSTPATRPSFQRPQRPTSSGRGFGVTVARYTKAGPIQIRNSRSTDKHFLNNPDNEMDDGLSQQDFFFFFVIMFLLTFQRKWKRLTYNWLKELEVIKQARKCLGGNA